MAEIVRASALENEERLYARISRAEISKRADQRGPFRDDHEAAIARAVTIDAHSNAQ